MGDIGDQRLDVETGVTLQQSVADGVHLEATEVTFGKSMARQVVLEQPIRIHQDDVADAGGCEGLSGRAADAPDADD